MAKPEAKDGKKLSEETLELVHSFFEDDDNRQMPGKKDCISVGNKQYKQKQLELCKEEIKGISFIDISQSHMNDVRENLRICVDNGKTIPSTRSSHHFIPLSMSKISHRLTSEDEDVDVFDFDNKKAITNVIELRVSAYVSCIYNTFWWIGLILEVDVELGDVKIDFLHPHGPRKTFTWPVGGDTCHIPMKNILCSISAPLTATGRTYNILDVDYQNTVSASEKHNTK